MASARPCAASISLATFNDFSRLTSIVLTPLSRKQSVKSVLCGVYAWGARWSIMRQRFSVARIAFVALFAFCLFMPVAHDAQASVLRTFDFTQSGWISPGDPGGSAGYATGSFSGYVEPSGYLELSDLTSFNLDLRTFSSEVTGGLGDLSLFSYKPGGGASTLDIEWSHLGIQFCMGASVQLAPACDPSSFPSTALGSSNLIGYDYTLNAPVITEVGAPAPISMRFSWSEILMGATVFGLFRLVGAIRPASVVTWLCRLRPAAGKESV